jgi:hypothetical protein
MELAPRSLRKNDRMLCTDLACRIERLIGTKVEPYRPVEGGYTPATRLRWRWLDAMLLILIRVEERCSTDGNSLTPWDLWSDNLCITERRAVFVDWNHVCLSNLKLDLGFWLLGIDTKL